MPALLDVGSQITCPHGGKVTVIPSQGRVMMSGLAVSTMADSFLVAGCAFAPGGMTSPCIKIQWGTPATRVVVQGVAVLLQSSVGVGQNAALAPQGPALVAGVQQRVQGL